MYNMQHGKLDPTFLVVRLSRTILHLAHGLDGDPTLLEHDGDPEPPLQAHDIGIQEFVGKCMANTAYSALEASEP